MAEAEATQDGETPAGASSAQTLDLTEIRGFQVLPAAKGDAHPDAPDDETRKLELAKEFAARATRLAEAVDDALVLANDGAIRWLGDPVAKLVAGDDTLKPRAVILADDALAAEGRETVQRRVELWIAAHIRKTLGPLISLAEPEAESLPEGAREIAVKLAQALGVLERERVKAQVKALDQNARGALRKMGVRFGAFYIYVPALLKPAARTLSTQLWALLRGEADKEAVADKVLHFAASGRTSFAVEPPASADVYRVAGFRLCGDRAVRVDIVERLTDLIRAALPRPTQSGARPPAGEGADGFVVTNQMTSLTGCSGDHFASILRSLGFVSHKVKKSEFLEAARKAAAAAASVVAAPPPLAPSEPVAEAAALDAAEAIATTFSEPVEEDAAHEASIETEPMALLDEAAPAPADNPADAADVAPAPSEAESALAESAPAESAPAEIAHAEAVAEAEAAAASPDAPASATEAAAASAEPEKLADDELIDVWRPAPRHARHPGRDRNRPPHGGRAAPAQAAPGHEAAPAQSPEGRSGAPDGAQRKPWRDRRHGGGPRPAQADGAQASEQGAPRDGQKPASEPARDGRRPQWRRDGAKGPRFDGAKGPRAEEGRAAEPPNGAKGRPRPPQQEQRKPSVNLDSPFAKLLDLKPLLKARDTTK